MKSLSEELTLAQSAYDEAWTKLEQVRHGANLAVDYFEVQLRAEQLLHAAKQMALVKEQIEQENKGIII